MSKVWLIIKLKLSRGNNQIIYTRIDNIIDFIYYSKSNFTIKLEWLSFKQ